MNLEGCAVEIPLGGRQGANFTTTIIAHEGRALTDVEETMIPSVVREDVGEVDPIRGKQHLRVEAEVCRRVAEGSSDLLPLNDVPDENRRSTEETCGILDVTFAKEMPDSRAAHRLAIGNYGGNAFHLESEFLSQRAKSLDVTLTMLSEAEPLTHHNPPRVQLADDDALDEFAWGETTHVGEANEDDPVDGRAKHGLAQCDWEKETRRRLRSERQPRRALEDVGDALAALLPRLPVHPVEDPTVPKVNPVEGSDRQSHFAVHDPFPPSRDRRWYTIKREPRRGKLMLEARRRYNASPDEDRADCRCGARR